MKMFKKALATVLSLLVIFCCMATALAAGESVTVKLRIEGIDSCLYYGDVAVNKGSTVYDVLVTADKNDDTLTVKASDGIYGKYVYDINGIVSGSYTTVKFDGWSYMVDGVSPEKGLSAYTVSEGESIVVYYADPWNTGMQYPVMDTSKLASGVLSFTSTDTVYDENYNPVTKEVAVTGYKLTFGLGNGKTVELFPDENGNCKIPYKYLTYGKHTVQIERYDEKTGLPTVLRFAPDYGVSVSFFSAFLNFFKMIFESITARFA